MLRAINSEQYLLLMYVNKYWEIKYAKINKIMLIVISLFNCTVHYLTVFNNHK